jgi:transposase-like protein
MSLSKNLFKRRRTDPAQREQLLATFERSGLSAAEFARQQGFNYTTFCGWRQRRGQTPTPPAFVQIDLAAPVAPVELVIEVGALARLRLQSDDQIPLAAKLLQHLNAGRPC